MSCSPSGSWRRGSEVTAGAVVFELETDKTTAEVEAETSGWLHRLVAVGEKIPIGASVGLIAETREEYEAVARASAETSADDNPFLGYISHGGGTAVAQAVVASGSRSEDAPSTPLTPARHGSTGTGGGVPLVAPRARALLARLGYSLDHAREITGSGPGGRITDRDVAEWAETRRARGSRRPLPRLGRPGWRCDTRSRCGVVEARSPPAWFRVSRPPPS